MSTNKSEHLQLHLWEPGDSVLRTEFNENWETLDASAAQAQADLTSGLGAITAVLNAGGKLARIAWGSYTGNGTSGPESPVSLAFSFPPQLLAVRRSGSSADRSGLLLLRGVTQGGGLGHIDFYVNVTWSGNQVSWYTSKDNPSTQMNSEGVEYFYFAIG